MITEGELLAILRVPAFRQYVVSQAASGLATNLLQALILWQVYAISGSTLSLGIVGLVGFVSAFLSSLIGGVVVDAYDRRMILFASQIVPGLGSLAMLAAIATDHVSLELIYAPGPGHRSGVVVRKPGPPVHPARRWCRGGCSCAP